MVDDTVLLDHAFYMGFYLAVLDRRDLSLAYSGFFNTSTITKGHAEGDRGVDLGYPFKRSDGYLWIDDFGIANSMARKIKQYDFNYFIVVISQYSWEQQFSK